MYTITTKIGDHEIVVSGPTAAGTWALSRAVAMQKEMSDPESARTTKILEGIDSRKSGCELPTPTYTYTAIDMSKSGVILTVPPELLSDNEVRAGLTAGTALCGKCHLRTNARDFSVADPKICRACMNEPAAATIKQSTPDFGHVIRSKMVAGEAVSCKRDGDQASLIFDSNPRGQSNVRFVIGVTPASDVKKHYEVVQNFVEQLVLRERTDAAIQESRRLKSEIQRELYQRGDVSAADYIASRIWTPK